MKEETKKKNIKKTPSNTNKTKYKSNMINGILLVVFLVLIGVLVYINPLGESTKMKMNVDINGDGKCDLNCDTNNDGKCDLNCDYNGDNRAEFNVDNNNDGLCELNCDTNGDKKAVRNIDTTGDGKCDKNCTYNATSVTLNPYKDSIKAQEEKEYVKLLSNTTRCTEEYTKNGNICVKETDARKNYSCNQGTLQGNECLESKQATKNTNRCPNGGTVKNNKCIETKEMIENTDRCPNGGTLEEDKCIQTKEPTLVCPQGTVEFDNECLTPIEEELEECETGKEKDDVCYSPENPKAKVQKCEEGYNLTDNKCIKEETAKDKNICPSGYTKNSEEKCDKIYDAQAEYTCASGYKLDGTKCNKYSSANVKYSCELGELSGTKCVFESVEPIQTLKYETGLYNDRDRYLLVDFLKDLNYKEVNNARIVVNDNLITIEPIDIKNIKGLYLFKGLNKKTEKVSIYIYPKDIDPAFSVEEYISVIQVDIKEITR